MTYWADPEVVKDWAAELPQNILWCREIGHRWNPFTASWNDELQVFERTLRCARCTTRRAQLISGQGAVLKSSYDYVDHYIVPHLGRLGGGSRDVLRLESIGRTIATAQSVAAAKKAVKAPARTVNGKAAVRIETVKTTRTGAGRAT